MDKGLQEPMSQLVYGKFERRSPRASTSSASKQGAQLAELPLLLREPADSACPRPEGRRRRALPQGLQLQAAARHRALHSQRSRHRQRHDQSHSDAERTTGRKRIVATSGQDNFDEIREIVVRDQNLAFEMFKKGDLDYYYVKIPRAVGRGAQFERVQRGLIQKAKVYNELTRRHRRPRLQHAQGALRRRPGKARVGPLAEPRNCSSRRSVQRTSAAELVLHRRLLREPEQPEERVRPAARAQAAGRSRLEGPRRAGPTRPRTANR